MTQVNSGKYLIAIIFILLPLIIVISVFMETRKLYGMNVFIYFIFKVITMNVPASTIYSRDTVILFEILDFNAKFLKEIDEERLDKDNLYRIAWGYIRPYGFI